MFPDGNEQLIVQPDLCQWEVRWKFLGTTFSPLITC